jgi:hypothetical protein
VVRLVLCRQLHTGILLNSKGDTMINDEEFYKRDDGTKCVSFFCDLDIVVLTERDIKWFQEEFDKLDKETK